MSHNTDNPAFPIIEFLNKKIKGAEETKHHWEENYQRPTAEYFRKAASHRLLAFKEVLEFITENFNDND